MKSKDLEIFNEMPFYFWFKDEDGRYLWANRVLLEFAKTDMLGKTDNELPWVGNADALRAADKQVLETGETLRLRELVIDKPEKVTVNACKWLGELDGKKGVFGVSFVID